MMKKLAIVFAVGAAALMGGSAAYAADNAVKSKSSTDATQSRIATQLPRPISVRNTAIGIGMAITTGATVITGRTITATATMRRVRTATTGLAIMAADPA